MCKAEDVKDLMFKYPFLTMHFYKNFYRW